MKTMKTMKTIKQTAIGRITDAACNRRHTPDEPEHTQAKYFTSTATTSEPLVRPVKCAVCQQPMVYYGQPGSEPEIKVTVELPHFQPEVEVKNMHSLFGQDGLYIHLRCWNALPITLYPSTV